MRSTRFLLAALVVVMLGGPIAAQVGIAAFTEELARIERFLERKDHRRAGKGLDDLLEAHAERDYVRARREELVELRRRIDFAAVMKRPDPKDLVSGKLSKYSLNTGQLTLEYDIGKEAAKWSADPDSKSDFQIAGDLCIHKVQFAGPYTVDISVPTKQLTGIMVMQGEDEGYICGMSLLVLVVDGLPLAIDIQGSIARVEKGKIGEAKTASLKWTGRRDGLDFRVKVTTRSIELVIDNRPIVRHDNDGRFGCIALPTDGLPGAKLKISGKAEPAFLQDRLDGALAFQRRRFDERFDPKAVLPAWLFEAIESPGQSVPAGEPGPTTGSDGTSIAGGTQSELRPTAAKRPRPGNLDAIHPSPVENFFEAIDKADVATARAMLAKAQERGLDANGALWLETRIAAIEGDWSGVLDKLAELEGQEPGHLDAEVLRVEALLALERRAEATRAARTLLEAHPDEALAYETAIPVLLVAGRAQDGKDILDLAIGRGVDSDKLRELNRSLVKALKGPVFSRRFEHRSEHYLVVSDIDSKVCRQTAAILEQGYEVFSKELVAPPEVEEAPFAVFVFAGQDGYLDFANEVFGGRPRGSLGLFTPMLKQLLIWNAPTRETMDQTIRHEGFHQYLDRVLPNAPIWLNEGLAVYNETGKLEYGKWKVGETRRDYLRVLEGSVLVPSARFLRFSPRDFQDPMAIIQHYGQAWLTLHFLLNDDWGRPLFDAYLGKLREGLAMEVALTAVFGDDVLAALDLKLKNHLLKLAD